MVPIVFSSADANAPTLTNAAGSVVGLLDACLVTGFNTQAVLSVSVAQGVATVTTVQAHGFLVHEAVTLSGATAVPALNGSAAVLSVPSPVSFTVATSAASGSGPQGAGASVRRTPLGFTKLFSDANKAVYQSGSVQAFGQVLAVNHVASGVARVWGAQGATAVDALSDAFPGAYMAANTGLAWGTSAASAQWWLVGDAQFFYLFATYYGGVSVCAFGDVVSFKAGEGFATVLSGATPGNESGGLLWQNQPLGQSIYGGGTSLVCRAHTGLQKGVAVGAMHPMGAPGVYGMAYPSPVDNGTLFLEPVLLIESAGVRGVLPGAADCAAIASQLLQGAASTVVEMTDGSAERFLVFATASQSSFSLRISSAWR